jgi:hypothetical protein
LRRQLSQPRTDQPAKIGPVAVEPGEDVGAGLAVIDPSLRRIFLALRLPLPTLPVFIFAVVPCFVR